MTDATATAPLHAVLAENISRDDLPAALEAAIAGVKTAPNDTTARIALAQLAALSGDLSRAETHLRLAQTHDEQHTLPLGEARQYLRGLAARDAWWSDGAAPEFPGGPTECDTMAMASHVAWRAGDTDGAASAAQALENARAPCPVTCNGTHAEDMRDVDDRLPHALEALTPGGHYLWLDLARIERITFKPVAAPFDLLARAARVTLRDGAASDLRFAAIYDAPRSPEEQLARSTDFTELAPGLVRAHGQRAFLVGDEMVGLLELTDLVFDDG